MTAASFNLSGFLTLLHKEIMRFMKVWVQTVVTPMITALLYLAVFAHVLAGRSAGNLEVEYTAFLVPGLIMMSVIQNAFANSSSSLIQGKMNGSLTFLMLAPLSALEIWLAFVLAAVARGALVGFGVYAVALVFVDLPLSAPAWIIVFLLLGGALLGVLGLLAGILAEKFDHLSAFQNFVILPASFLSGVFYSIHSLPQPWDSISRLNPFFYMIDGFRYGFLGVGDVSPWHSLLLVAAVFVLVSVLCLILLARGYKLRP